MPFSLLPTVMTSELTDLTPEYLHSRNIKLLMMDFDNTIVPYTTSVATEKMDAWLTNMAASDIILCVVSNSKKDRVKIFCEKYGIPVITHANKPFSKGIVQCLRKFDVKPQQAAIVGDQIFTDTLGGNCVGLTTVLVKAIDNHNFWLKARHVLEKPFIYRARKRRLNHEKS